MDRILSDEQIRDIEAKVGHSFRDKSLLRQAFAHPSYANERDGVRSYQRLEYLGDAVLYAVIAQDLFARFPDAEEGALTEMRMSLIREDALAEITDELGIIEHLKTAKGRTRSMVAESSRVKCDLFESLVGAVFADCDFAPDAARDFILRFLRPELHEPRVDYKSLAASYFEKNGIAFSYECGEDPSNGACRYSVVLRLADSGKTYLGRGRKKKDAERDACRAFWLEHAAE